MQAHGCSALFLGRDILEINHIQFSAGPFVSIFYQVVLVIVLDVPPVLIKVRYRVHKAVYHRFIMKSRNPPLSDEVPHRYNNNSRSILLNPIAENMDKTGG